jgi:hypothetical protein
MFFGTSWHTASEPLVHNKTSKRKAHRHPSNLYSLTSHTAQLFAANPNELSEFHRNAHAADTGKQTALTVLPPFSGKLCVDKKLQLSNDDFKQSVFS